jgi:uncharacterized protein
MTADSAPNASLQLSVLEERLAVCRLEPHSEIPRWATSAPFFCVTRTPDELSVICPEQDVPAGTTREAGWRAFKLEGTFGFGLVGVLASVAAPLAESGVGILAIATHDTDYLLVKEEQLGPAMAALREQGHRVR